MDKFKEECGIFGIFGHTEAANMKSYPLRYGSSKSVVAMLNEMLIGPASGSGSLDQPRFLSIVSAELARNRENHIVRRLDPRGKDAGPQRRAQPTRRSPGAAIGLRG